MMARTRGSSLATRHDESLEILEFALCALKPLLGGVCRLGGTQERIRDPRACGARLFPRLLQQPFGVHPRDCGVTCWKHGSRVMVDPMMAKPIGG